MKLSDFEIQKITEIVAGKMGTTLDGKQMRQVIDDVIDKIQANPANPEITGATCEVSSSAPSSSLIEDKKEGLSPLNSFDDAEKASAGLYQQIDAETKNRVIVATFGKNRPGVVASITNILAENNCSIEDISQTLMQEFFSMIMVVDITGSKGDFEALRNRLKDTESQLGMKVYVMHEDIFRYMHRI